MDLSYLTTISAPQYESVLQPPAFGLLRMNVGGRSERVTSPLYEKDLDGVAYQ